jgi:hypothetical protein
MYSNHGTITCRANRQKVVKLQWDFVQCFSETLRIGLEENHIGLKRGEVLHSDNLKKNGGRN